MRRGSFRGTFLVAALAAACLAGCGANPSLVVNTQFTYKPGAPKAGAAKVPVKVAVLPFADGTEDFTSRGSVLAPESLEYNLAKAGIGGTITAVTPELWAKSFADELAASGLFRTVRFVYSSAELTDDDYSIEGRVEKAYAAGAFDKPSEFAVHFRALRREGRQPVWEREVVRNVTTPRSVYDGCGTGLQCMADRSHAQLNKTMREMFDEAGASLASALKELSAGGGAGDGSWADGSGEGESAKPAAPESVERTIERILKAK